MKPIVYGPIHNGFSDQDKQVSISIDVLDFSDRAEYKVYLQIEPEEIVPIEENLIRNHDFYDLILSWNEKVLVSCPNASKFIFGTCRWATNPPDDCNMESKKFAVSFLTSSKAMCPGHYFRHEVYNGMPAIVGSVPITKHMSPPEVEKKDLLYPFQFSIIMENVRRKNWITEKLIDCLVARTVPIYWGAENVGEYFDSSGILTFENYSDLVRVLSGLTRDTYRNLIPAVERNLREAMKYTDLHSRVDEEIRRRLSDYQLRSSRNFREGQGVRQRLPQQEQAIKRGLHR